MANIFYYCLKICLFWKTTWTQHLLVPFKVHLKTEFSHLKWREKSLLWAWTKSKHGTNRFCSFLCPFVERFGCFDVLGEDYSVILMVCAYKCMNTTTDKSKQKWKIMCNMYLHMLVDICPGLFANICLDPSNIHASTHSSHLGFPLLVNELHIYRELDISELLHQSVKCKPSHTNHWQDPPYRDNNFVTWLSKFVQSYAYLGIIIMFPQS